MKTNQNSYIFNIKPDEFISLESYRKQNGYAALEKALKVPVEETLNEIKSSELKGRGGAAFPTGIKIESVRFNEGEEKFIICNADEGEPGTFKDRFIMTHTPFQLLEGITIAAFLAGAGKGYIYVRHEYPEAQKVLKKSIRDATSAGLLGENILESGFSLELTIFSGAGSYLCGEETALLSSIEGKKGRPRLKPPYPTEKGLWNRPTLINNVETLSNIPVILEKGANWYRSIGTISSRGTKLISLSGDVCNRGVFEVPFGTTFKEIINEYGGGVKNGREIKAVNIGGASGVLVPENMLEIPLDYEKCKNTGITIGSGAIFVLDDTRSILENVLNRVNFFLHESCGKCTPCREGLRQTKILLEKIFAGKASSEDIETLARYTRTMQRASFCGLGQAAGNSLSSSLNYYMDEYLSMCANNKIVTKEEGIA